MNAPWIVKAQMMYPDGVLDLAIQTEDTEGREACIFWMRDMRQFGNEQDARRFVNAMRQAYPCVPWTLHKATGNPDFRYETVEISS